MRKVLLNAVGSFRAGDVFDPDQGQQRQIDAATSLGGVFVDASTAALVVAELATAAYARGDSGSASGIMLASQGGGGSGDLFLFTGDGSPHSDITFGRWSELMEMTAALQASASGLKPRIRFTNSFTVPTEGMPVTGWPCARAAFESTVLNTGAITLTLPAGATLDMLEFINNGLGISFAPAVDGESLKFSQIAPGTGPQIFGIGNGATITHGTSTKALVKTAGAVNQTFFVFASSGGTWLAPLTGPIALIEGGDVAIGSQVLGGYQGFPDGWVKSTSPAALLLYQNSISSSFPLVTFAGTIFQMFNGTDSLQLNQRGGALAGRAALATLPGGYALKVGTTYFATDYGPNGGPLWWNGSAWVDSTGAVVP